MDVVERTGVIAPEPARAVAGLLGLPMPDLDGRAPLPLPWQWFYLLDLPATPDLGPDGHARTGVVPAPPGPGRRRMWAGGRVTMRAGLRVGAPATKRSRVVDSVDKQGRSGRLTFVTVRHEYLQGGELAVEEEQDIVYRDEPVGRTTPPVAAPPAPLPTAGPVLDLAEGERYVETPSTLLFRFSALTYNGHRIHYDREYARDVEGYPGLVVHGPLQAVLMAAAARARAAANEGDRAGDAPERSGTTFAYRLESPAHDIDGGIVAGAEPGPDGALATRVRLTDGRTTASGLWTPAGARC